ncbi:hypothetical protein MTsN3n11_28520 [Qipengyuania sp. MTN3-11]
MVALHAAFLAMAAPASLAAQTSGPPERIDLTIDQDSERIAALRRECEEKQEAAQVSEEIVVCAQIEDDAASAGWDQEDWENRYAAETRGRDPVDPCGPNCGIFKGEPTIGGLCIPGLQKCPPPPALIVDFSTLPEAPPGSDADRIARGLLPLGNSGPSPEPAPATGETDSLGLPPPPDFAGSEREAVSPAESGGPAAPQ